MSTEQARVTEGVGSRWLRGRSWYRRYSSALMLSMLLCVFLVVVLWRWIAVPIPAGYVGVKWYRFAGGTDTETVYGEGSRFIYPWDGMTLYDARLQQFDRDFDVLTSDGLMMTINIAARFRLNDTSVGLLHKHMGPAYVETLLVPTLGSFARIIFSQNSTDAVYTDRRIAVQGEIKQAVTAELGRYLGQRDHRSVPWVYLDDVLIRSMRFPPEVQSAVNRKMAQYQLREEYAYRLQREELESQRKEIEAQGIARFQSIVGAGISDTYLRWRGIDATLALAQSPNAKIVVIGTGKDGMPLILGGMDQPHSVRSAPDEPANLAPKMPGPKYETPLSDLPPATPRPENSRAGESRSSLPPPIAYDEIYETLRELAELGKRDAAESMRLPVPEVGSSSKPDKEK